MKLSVQERIILAGLLPQEGNILTLRVVNELLSSLGFTEAEHERLQFVTEGTQIKWQQGAVNDKEIAIGDKAREVIVSALKKANEAGKVHISWLPVYDRFIKEGV